MRSNPAGIKRATLVRSSLTPARKNAFLRKRVKMMQKRQTRTPVQSRRRNHVEINQSTKLKGKKQNTVLLMAEATNSNSPSKIASRFTVYPPTMEADRPSTTGINP